MSKQRNVIEANPTDEAVKISIALHVRDYMRAEKMTYKELADVTNLSELTLRKIKKGKEMPRIPTVRRLAALMGNDIIDLLKPILEVETEKKEAKTEKSMDPEESRTSPIEEFAKLSDFKQRLLLFADPSLQRIYNYIISEIGGSCL